MPPFPSPAPPSTDSPAAVTASLLSGSKLPAHLAAASVESPSEGAVGRLDEAHYERLMPPWRFRIRQKLVRSLEWEMEVLQGIQKRWRTPFRDEYFVKTSLAGTHTFFMLFLPLWFWFGLPEVGLGLLYVLALGAYATSSLKDAFSVPRPFSPPVIRLSVGNHALEYGFPSTHSSNSCSMALFCGELLLRREGGEREWWTNVVGVVALAVFAWSVVFGRLYTGMHSMMDVATGSTIGIVIWALHSRYTDALHTLLSNSRWTGTLISISTLLLALSTHPEPVEPCPCFEDTVAFLSVVVGAMIGVAWTPQARPTSNLGWQWRDGEDVAKWVGAVGVKLVGGIAVILVWRIVAKQVCHTILPPLFRFFAPIIQLPRRGYEPATSYDAYPPSPTLHPIPSILDLPFLVSDSELSPAANASSSSRGRGLLNTALRNRAGASAAATTFSLGSSAASSAATSPTASPSLSSSSTLSRPPPQPLVFPASTAGKGRTAAAVGEPEEHQHKDADVLTKVIVYGGIGWIATIGLPEAFERVGWSVWR